MGGHNAGEIASRLAVDALRELVRQSATDDDFTWPFGVDPSLSFNGNRLSSAIRVANRIVFQQADARDEYQGMGTTVVAVLVDGPRLTFAGVGDSRIYSLRDSELRQLTRDDSWIAMLAEDSGLDAAAFEKHPMRHVLTSVIGARPDLTVTVHERELTENETIVLCTDGLHGALGDAGLRAILIADSDLEVTADALVAAALARDGRDNISVVLVRYTPARWRARLAARSSMSRHSGNTPE